MRICLGAVSYTHLDVYKRQDLKEQKYVCTLAECKSLTRASERLYISQPALSLYINNVEKNLGAPLFERNGRKFELTWLGKQYVEKACLLYTS